MAPFWLDMKIVLHCQGNDRFQKQGFSLQEQV